MDACFFLQIEFMKDKPCEKLCRKSYKVHDKDSETKLHLLKTGMSLNYQHHWIVGK
jgi:transmembrane 9 superfamily protein 2/4